MAMAAWGNSGLVHYYCKPTKRWTKQQFMHISKLLRQNLYYQIWRSCCVVTGRIHVLVISLAQYVCMIGQLLRKQY